MAERERSLLDLAGGVGELDPDVVLDRVLGSAWELTRARYAALCVLNAGRTGLARFITAGIGDHARAEIGVLPRGGWHGVPVFRWPRVRPRVSRS